MRFLLVAVGASAVLFLVWPNVSLGYCRIVSALGSWLRAYAGLDAVDLLGEKDTYLLIPVVAVMAASVGHGWKRKAAFIGSAALGVTVLGSLSVAFDLVTTAGRGDTAAAAFFALFGTVLPLGILVAFIGAEPWRLWERMPQPLASVACRCPLCGAGVADVAAHIRQQHGARALRDPRVRRLLNKRESA